VLACVASTRTLEPLGTLPQLLELSVEHNPLCSVTPAVYRPELLVRLAAFSLFSTSMRRLTAVIDAQALLTATLTKLDSHEVTQSERVAAQEAHVVRVSAAAVANGTNMQTTDGEMQGTASRLSAR
jgi:hypothetical protein